jgi:molybdopterin synthase catalytic subunit
MRVTVRLFAMQRQQLGRRALDLDLADGASIGDAWAALSAAHPVLAPAGPTLRFARNGAYADASTPLADGDEVALIPPVAGGAGGEPGAPGAAGAPPMPAGPPTAGDPPTAAGPPTAGDPQTAEGTLAADPPRSRGPYRRIELHEEPFDDALLVELRRAVASSADGAVVVFLGQTRASAGTPAPGQEAEAARFAGRPVQALDYEAFEPMALAVLDAIADEIAARFGVSRLAILHRTGPVPLGEASVVIAVAAGHRGEAFDAARYAIEELKARAPIWKSERFADGSVWVGAPARTGPAPERVSG